jgi:hypothetical protein
MTYSDHTFSKISFKNKADDLPRLTLEYMAVGPDDTVKDAKDSFVELPHASFRDAWGRLLPHWKGHLEDVIGEVEWDLERARVTTIRLEEMNGMVATVRYWVTCYTASDDAVTISTPEVATSEEERAVLEEVREAAVEFLEGARDQESLFEIDEDDFPSERKN